MQASTVGPGTDTMEIVKNSSTAQKLAGFKKLGGVTKATPEQIDATAQDFEAQFISQMMENMFSTVDTDGALDGGESEKTYRSMMIDQYGKMIAKSGGIGVADQVKREMLKLQEVGGATPATAAAS